MKNKRKEMKEALSVVKDGDTIMVGGFLQCGNPQYLGKVLTEETNVKNLTIISSDTSTMETNNYDLYKTGKAKKIIADYIGGNPEAGRFMFTGAILSVNGIYAVG